MNQWPDHNLLPLTFLSHSMGYIYVCSLTIVLVFLLEMIFNLIELEQGQLHKVTCSFITVYDSCELSCAKKQMSVMDWIFVDETCSLLFASLLYIPSSTCHLSACNIGNSAAHSDCLTMAGSSEAVEPWGRGRYMNELRMWCPHILQRKKHIF